MQIDIGWPAAAQTGNGVEQSFVTHRDCVSGGAQQAQADLLIGSGGVAAAHQDRHTLAEQRRCVRHDAQDTGCIAEPGLQARCRYTRGDRHEEFLGRDRRSHGL